MDKFVNFCSVGGFPWFFTNGVLSWYLKQWLNIWTCYPLITVLLLFLFVCLFVCLFLPYPWHMEVPRPGIQCWTLNLLCNSGFMFHWMFMFQFHDKLKINLNDGMKNTILVWNPLVASSEAWIQTRAWYLEGLSNIKDNTWRFLQVN